jgi:hypothetical protein
MCIGALVVIAATCVGRFLGNKGPHDSEAFNPDDDA